MSKLPEEFRVGIAGLPPAKSADGMASSGETEVPVGTRDDSSIGATSIDPAALTVVHLARLLGVPEAKVREHVTAGAPTASNGTMHLIRYVAWLNQRLKERDGPEV